MNILGTYFFQPTRITHRSETIYFLTQLSNFTTSGNQLYDLTDHLQNFLIIKNFPSLPANVKISKRDYSNFNETALVNGIQAIDW